MSYDLGVVGKNIRCRRNEMGLTQNELGKAINHTGKQISKYEKSDGSADFPPLDNLLKLCNRLDCELGYLLGEKEYAAGTKTETIVQEYTGLSHESLKTIRELCCKEKSNSFLMNYELVNSSIILNKLLCSPRFVYLIAQLVEYEEEIIDYQNLESAAINEVGKEAWQQAPDLYQSKECKLNELSDNQIRTIELFDDYLNKQREYKQREKIYRYNIHEEFELLVEDLYPRLHYNQNN